MLPDMANHIITLMRKAKREGEVMQKMRKKSGIMLLWAMVLTLMLSLAYAPGVEAATKKSNVKSVTVTNLPAKKLTLKKGKSKTLKVKVTSTNKKKASQKVTYKSSKPKIVTVSSKGKVTAKKKGTATITITSKSNTKKNVKITVKVGTPVTSVSLNKTKATVQTGKSITLKATVKPKKPTTKDVIWSTSNSSIAKVSSKGKVKTLKAGKVKITATAADGSGKKKTATITVKDPVVVKKVDVVNGSTVQVTLSQATDLTAAAFTVKSNQHGGSTYNRICKIDNVTSTDKTTYLVVLDSRDELNDHDHIQVTVTGLWGSKTSTGTAVYSEGAFKYTYERVWRETYQESVSRTIGNNGYGYAAFTVTDLPAGIKTEQVEDSIRFYGKPQAKGKFVSQVVVADESGNTYTYAITWLISSADTLCTAPYEGYDDDDDYSKLYYVLDAKGVANIKVSMRTNGGSGNYKYSLVGTNYGLSINENNGKITGELKAASDYTVKVQVQDTVNTNLTATADVVIHVKQSIVVSGLLKDLGGASLSNNRIIDVLFINKDKSDRFVTSKYAEIDENGAFSVALVNGTYDIKATCETGSGATQKYLYSQKLDTSRSGFDITLAVRKVNIVSDNSNVKLADMTDESGWEDADGEVYGHGESLFLKEGTYNLTNKGRFGHLDVTATVTVNTSQALATAHVTTADTSSAITAEKPVQVSLKSSYTFFAFTPSSSGTYYFYSNNSSDYTYGVLEDASGNRLMYDGGSNFYFSYNCTAGTTYYVGICGDYSSGTATLNITATDPKTSDEGDISTEALNNVAEAANTDKADAAPADAAEAEKDTTAEPDRAEVTDETAEPDKAEVTDETAEPDKAEVTDEAAESDKAKAADETAESDKSESTDETAEEPAEPTGNDVAVDKE